ncbi:MAG: D-glycero-beta-D-manno-heptose-7-phosphate kinase, partial [Alphaproteobacteria bacterium]|nr:D-glycero-beta-D-manno-heptose-7-phosphate kinase [Alphaproteobacteria bacterium]
MTDSTQLLPHVDRLKQARLLCVGDVMLDRFVHGDVERISPEAPIPVVRIRREASMLGGAGNVLRNMMALGASPHFVSVVGDDAAGREVGNLIGAGIETAPALVVEAGRQTTIKTRYFAASQQLLRADSETLAPLTARSTEALATEVLRLLPQIDVLVLSDYGKGVLAAPLVARLVEAATKAGKAVVVDPKGRDYSAYRGARVVTPNRKELAEATGRPVSTEAEIVEAARHLAQTCGVEAVLVTRSQDGMTLVSGDEVHHLPAEAREVFDVSGAGDTVVATLAAAMAIGAPLVEAARLANVAAGIVVGKVGTAVAYAAELETALRHTDLRAGEDKILDRETAGEVVARWRRQSFRVGFTNGCFDLLHPGHIALLAQARAACDRLIVGLNSDASVARLKGPHRPVQSETSRAVVLSSLGMVDAVVVFGEDTPLSLIQALKPDVLVKGADYTVATVVGADQVQSWGGRVLLADLAPGHSTTATIARMGK